MEENNATIKKWKELDIRFRIAIVIGIIGISLFFLIPAILLLLQIISPDTFKFDKILEYVLSGVSGIVGIVSLGLAIFSMKISNEQNRNTNHILNQHSTQLTQTLSDIRVLITNVENVNKSISNVAKVKSFRDAQLQGGQGQPSDEQ